MAESDPSEGQQLDVSRAFSALITPSHRAVLASVAAAGEAGRCFRDLLELSSKQPALSQQLARLIDAKLITSHEGAAGRAFRLGPSLSMLNRWFETLNLADLAAERAERAHLELQPLLGCLGLPLCRRIATELSGVTHMMGVQLSHTLAVSAPDRSRALKRMSEAGLIAASPAHPHVRYSLQHDAVWRAWDWIYDLAPATYGESC